ncbi:hypothetical protein [Caballeronia sp. LZ001]|uniref:hypothetical protein n=1 Tax=Caballeronia sp. LZ001 TaxID=3038553 RepID=UPI002859CD8B|nr:hypothetical protein [Caballeronia sp. LZ001]MDR5801171.1 hypothetical protein [Caballeronia sp. LZ001]
MIPDIGLMVGLYIITRMIALISDKAQHTASRLFAAGTILVALICIVDLMSKGGSAPPL